MTYNHIQEQDWLRVWCKLGLHCCISFRSFPLINPELQVTPRRCYLSWDCLFDRDKFHSARCPIYISNGADGSKRQILSAIDPTSIYLSEHSHGTDPNDPTSHYLRQDLPSTGPWLLVDWDASLSKWVLHSILEIAWIPATVKQQGLNLCIKITSQRFIIVFQHIKLSKYLSTKQATIGIPWKPNVGRNCINAKDVCKSCHSGGSHCLEEA